MTPPCSLRLDLGVRDDLLVFGDLRLQLVGKIGRQILRSPQSVPRYECEAFHAGLLHGRNLGCRGRALEAGEAERLDLTALRQRPPCPTASMIVFRKADF